jgi:hypothetical protein
VNGLAMSQLRRFIAPFTAVWLLVQVAGVAAESVTWAVADAAMECTCAHGDHAICPMHHRVPVRHGRCAMRADQTPDLAVVSSLLIPPALVTADGDAALPDDDPAPMRPSVDRARSGHARPLSPPPRS